MQKEYSENQHLLAENLNNVVLKHIFHTSFGWKKDVRPPRFGVALIAKKEGKYKQNW